MSDFHGNNDAYLEFNVDDLNERVHENNTSSFPLSSPSRISRVSSTSLLSPKAQIARKIRLLVRKVHLMSYICSVKYFLRQINTDQELIAIVLSILPPHILRIFDTVMVSEEKTLKNSVSMLTTWWKNNLGLRIVPRKQSEISIKVNKLIFKFNELKQAVINKSAYEDDLVKLFAIACIGLGIRVRILQSLSLVSASASNVQKPLACEDFKYVPTNWIEIYLFKEQRWIPVDCIQGTIDDKIRLEDKTRPHSFVIAIDRDEYIYDVTTKYASEYEQKSFRLRKDEDSWFRLLISTLNSNLNVDNLSKFRDTESVENNCSSTQQLGILEVPKTLSAIKNHPLLMLGSQLKKYEVFGPGTQPLGFFKDQPVYLKNQVYKVRSKDSWLNNFARIIKSNEIPIKVVKLPRKPGTQSNEEVQPLYAEWQTEPYVCPDLIDGKIPRNEHGNVDLFQPSMLPNGCVHITLPGAWKVAKYIGLDYADACTGFSFHGGRALPEIHGIIIIKDQLEMFEAKYKSSLIQSFKIEAQELEKQFSQKWCKIIKNALIAKRLKHDSSFAATISNENLSTRSEEEIMKNTVYISSLESSSLSLKASKDFEIEEFENI